MLSHQEWQQLDAALRAMKIHGDLLEMISATQRHTVQLVSLGTVRELVANWVHTADEPVPPKSDNPMPLLGAFPVFASITDDANFRTLQLVTRDTSNFDTPIPSMSYHWPLIAIGQEIAIAEKRTGGG